MLASLYDILIKPYLGLSKEIWILSLITLINRTGSMVIVFLTLYLTSELSFSYTEAGIAMSFYGVGSVAGSYIGGWLTDRVGYYPTMFWSLILGGTTFFGLMYVHSFYWFCAMILLASTIIDCFRPASMASIGTYSSPENHNRSLSLIRLAINLGFGCGAAATGFISFHYGYNSLFIIDGVTCIAAALLMRAILVEKKMVKPKQEKGITPVKSKSAYQDKNFMLFIGTKCIGAIAFMQLFSAFPVFVKEELHFTEDEFGLLMLMNAILIVLLEMPLVYSLEQKFKRMTLVIGGYLLFALAYFALIIPGYWIATLAFFIVAISIGEIIGFPFSNSFALSRSSEDRRGEFMGMYSMAFSVAFIIAPILGMYVAEEYGFTSLWCLSGVLCTVAVFGFIFIKGLIENEEMPDEAELEIIDAPMHVE